MAIGKALNGKSYAGNPRVRFDEGDVASAATPRRGSLLYNFKKSFVPTAVASVAVSALAVLPLAVCGAPVEVASVAELTNALTRVNNGEAIDMIVLKKSGNPYTFNDEYMGIINDGNTTNLLSVTSLPTGVDKLVIKGEDSSSRKTWTDHEEPIIIDGNGKGRIFYSDRQKVTLCNLTLTGGSSMYNEKGGWGGAAREEDEWAMDYLVFSNCVFRQNSAYQFAAVVYAQLIDCLVTNCTGVSVHTFRGKAYDSDFTGNEGGVGQYLYAYNCRFANNARISTATRTNGSVLESFNVLSNCVVEANTGWTIANCRDTTVVVGSTFKNNESMRGILCNPGMGGVKDCAFEGNVSFRGGAIYMNENTRTGIVDHCYFKGNVSTNSWNDNYGGGAILMQRMAAKKCWMVVTNCTFVENVSHWPHGGSTGGVRYAAPGGAICNWQNDLPEGEEPWESLAVYDSAFTNNFATLQVGGVLGVKAVRCTFKDNMRDLASATVYNTADRFGGEAALSYLEDCDISGRELAECVVNRCDIHDVMDPPGTNGVCVFRDYTRVTNSIVRNVTIREGTGECGMYFARRAIDAEFSNCSFISNNMPTVSFYGDVATTNTAKFINCLFHGNASKWVNSDIVVDPLPGYPLWESKVSFENSYYGKFAPNGTYSTQASFDAKTGENKMMLCVDPKFAKDDDPDAEYWSLSRKSPLLGKGNPQGFTSLDLDLAGHLRLRNDGAIDIGCYQSHFKEPGFLIFVR